LKIAIIQSCYIPWKGFFDLIGQCDEYVIFDSVQYARRHWHNRNKIKTPNGVVWLTIPVRTKGEFDGSIEEIQIEKPWAQKHWQSIEMAYTKAPHFKEVAPAIHRMYLKAANEMKLTSVNEIFLMELATMLGLKTRITRDSAYPKIGQKTDRLLNIALAAGATQYLSGPTARDYLSVPTFNNAGVSVEWMDYSNYPEYPQLHGEFSHTVSILDLLFNLGTTRAPAYITRKGQRSHQATFAPD
jgi:hypothetical protein